MIDLHCHVLPGIDDGVEKDDDALELSRELVAAGVQVVAATPHLREDYPAVRPTELAGRCADLAARLQAADIGLEVVPAAELDLIRGLEATAEELELVSFSQRGTDILLEAPYGPLPTSFEDQVFALVVRGYRILLAHPERNPTLQSDPARLAELVRRGILLQVTADSLVPRRSGSRSAGLARSLVSERMAHVLASDAHGPRGVRRLPLKAGLDEARALAGSYAEWMVEEAPAAILAGEPLPPAPVTPHKAAAGLRHRFLRWRGRAA